MKMMLAPVYEARAACQNCYSLIIRERVLPGSLRVGGEVHAAQSPPGRLSCSKPDTGTPEVNVHNVVLFIDEGRKRLGIFRDELDRDVADHVEPAVFLIFALRDVLPHTPGGIPDGIESVLVRDILKEQYEAINSRSLDVKEAKDGYIKGKISVEEAGTLFAAIPYDEGWSAKVDGKKVKIEKVQNAFMGIELTEGEHTVEFYYTAPGFYPGLLIMAISWGIFIFIIGRNSFGAKKKHSI